MMFEWTNLKQKPLNIQNLNNYKIKIEFIEDIKNAPEVQNIGSIFKRN
jgi:hypothetical protein